MLEDSEEEEEEEEEEEQNQDHDQVFGIEVLLAQRRRGGVLEYLVR
eukprot:SAG22_NODE_550_length_9202_cov_30.666484_12_plen_46_part_00